LRHFGHWNISVICLKSCVKTRHDSVFNLYF